MGQFPFWEMCSFEQDYSSFEMPVVSAQPEFLDEYVQCPLSSLEAIICTEGQN